MLHSKTCGKAMVTSAACSGKPPCCSSKVALSSAGSLPLVFVPFARPVEGKAGRVVKAFQGNRATSIVSVELPGLDSDDQ